MDFYYNGGEYYILVWILYGKILAEPSFSTIYTDPCRDVYRRCFNIERKIMTRCQAFYDKWERDPNFCDKSISTVKRIDHYLDLVHEIEAEGADVGAIYKMFSESVAREVFNLDGTKRKDIVFNAAGKIKRGERVTVSDIRAWAGIVPIGRKLTPDNGVKQKEPVSITTDTTPIISPQCDNTTQTAQNILTIGVTGAKVTPVIKSSPFITGAQMKEGKEPPQVGERVEGTAGGIGGVPVSGIVVSHIDDKTVIVGDVQPTEAELKKQKHAHMECLAEELVNLYPDGIRRVVAETIDYHPSYKNKDVIYKALELLGDQKLNKR